MEREVNALVERSALERVMYALFVMVLVAACFAGAAWFIREVVSRPIIRSSMTLSVAPSAEPGAASPSAGVADLSANEPSAAAPEPMPSAFVAATAVLPGLPAAASEDAATTSGAANVDTARETAAITASINAVDENNSARVIGPVTPPKPRPQASVATVGRVPLPWPRSAEETGAALQTRQGVYRQHGAE